MFFTSQKIATPIHKVKLEELKFKPIQILATQVKYSTITVPTTEISQVTLVRANLQK
jgi:hypothetical protein